VKLRQLKPVAPMLRALLLIGACSSASGGASGADSGSSSNGSAAATKEVTFFNSEPHTGQSAVYGNGSTEEAQLAVKQINDAGGFTDNCGNHYSKINLTVWDDGDNAAQSVAGMQKAAADKTNLAVIGSVSDIGWIPDLPVAGQLKMPFIIPSDGSTVAPGKWNPYAFRIQADAQTTFNVALPTLVATANIKRVGVLYDSTQAAQTSDAQLWQSNAAKLGYQVVAFESFRASDTNFRPQLDAIKAANPDFLVLDAADPSGLYNQATEVGLLPNVGVYSGTGTSTSAQEWDLTKGITKGSYSMATSAIGLDTGMHDTQAMTLYQTATGAPPDPNKISGWDAVLVAVDAVKRACTGTDREKFRDALAQTTKFPLAAQGTITWRNPPTGENQDPTGIVIQVTGKGTIQVAK
jgi:branched-chain amino acid transport system substrate-binding protein